MEKLQKALQKARMRRSDGVPQSQNAGAVGKPAARTVDKLWADLPSFYPDEKFLLRNRIVTKEASSDAIPFDMLRTKTILHMRKNNWTRLAITSATPDCGKTLVACNFAIGMVRQPEIRTLLMELDLRRPSIARMLGAKPKHNISRMLSGAIPFEENAVRLGNNVAVCMASRASVDPMQHLLSKVTLDCLRDIEARYQPDLMIFDLPPLMVSDDTSAFLSNVDCALGVVRAEKSTVSHVDDCEREIAEHTNVMGVVLNRYRFGKKTASYPHYAL